MPHQKKISFNYRINTVKKKSIFFQICFPSYFLSKTTISVYGNLISIDFDCDYTISGLNVFHRLFWCQNQLCPISLPNFFVFLALLKILMQKGATFFRNFLFLILEKNFCPKKCSYWWVGTFCTKNFLVGRPKGSQKRPFGDFRPISTIFLSI